MRLPFSASRSSGLRTRAGILPCCGRAGRVAVRRRRRAPSAASPHRPRDAPSVQPCPATTEIGMMPRRLTRPTVGLRPTRPLTAAGQMMLPSVSVPTPIAARLAAIAVPVPELEPHGLRSRTYGFFVCPPRELQPDVDRVERKFAHSLRFVLPRITAPASRRRADDERVLLRAVVGERERAGGVHHADDVDVVFDQDRNAVQRAANLAGLALGVQRLRIGDRRRARSRSPHSASDPHRRSAGCGRDTPA